MAIHPQVPAQYAAREYGQALPVLEAVEAVNNDQKQNKVFTKYGHDLQVKTFDPWGLAFNPKTDDLRNAISRVVIGALLRAPVPGSSRTTPWPGKEPDVYWRWSWPIQLRCWITYVL